MKSIAEQIYDAISRTSAIVSGDAYPSQEYCQRIADDCLKNKQELINILSKHPNWDADNLRVHFNKDYVRNQDRDLADSHLRDALRYVQSYISGSISSETITSEDSMQYKLTKLACLCEYIRYNTNSFTGNAITEDEVNYLRNDKCCLIYTVKGEVEIRFPDAHIHAGAKPTKQVLKLIRQYGFDLLPDEVQHEFLRHYSMYSDCMNPITITRHTVLSVNPVDFLYMSVGNSWTSCHNILEGGCYCAGCESYAYDTVSMIFYTVDADTPDDQITLAPKINRQMNFFNGDALLSSRVYPQSCDGDTGIYDECRGIVEQILSDCKAEPNMWKETPWTADSKGYQYGDYNVFKIKGERYKAYRLSNVQAKDRHSWVDVIPVTDFETGEITDFQSKFVIGSYDAKCACCGGTLDKASLPVCSECGSDNVCCCCDEAVSNDDAYYDDNGDCYCERCYYDHFTYCECCENYYPADGVSYLDSEGRYVCDDCLEEYYEQCENCGDYHYRDDMNLTHDDLYVCEDCIGNGDYVVCDDCGEIYPADECEEVEGVGFVCRDCLEDSYYRCTWCGEWFRDEDDGEETEEDGWVCNGCIENHYEAKYVRKENN